jgi:nitroreductase
MNEVLENIKNRRSIRKYKADPVPQELIDQVIEAGLYAASGADKQTAIIVAITNKEAREKITKINNTIGGWAPEHDPFYGAPVILLVLGDKASLNHDFDGSLILGNMMLAAHSLGLGSCWINRAREEFEMPEWQEWLKSIGINGNYAGVGHLSLGYADGEYPKAHPRKPNRVYYVK